MKSKLIFSIGGFVIIMIALLVLTSHQSVKTNGTIKKESDQRAATSQAQAQAPTSKNTTTNDATQKSANETGGKQAQTTSTDGNQSSSTNGNQPTSENEQVIVEKYQPKFQELNNNADKRVDNLIEQAKTEVKDKKEKHININGLQAKYVNILNRYEQTTRGQFDSIYGQFQDEATKNKLSDTTGKVFQVEYETKKDQRDQQFKKELKKLIG